MVLDGERVWLGDSSIHVDDIATAANRVATLNLALPQTHVIGGRAAAWIHGCAAEPHEIVVLINSCIRPVRLINRRLRVRRAQVHIERDSVRVGEYRVLNAERTAEDLLQNSPTADDVASAGLLREGLSLL